MTMHIFNIQATQMRGLLTGPCDPVDVQHAAMFVKRVLPTIERDIPGYRRADAYVMVSGVYECLVLACVKPHRRERRAEVARAANGLDALASMVGPDRPPRSSRPVQVRTKLSAPKLPIRGRA